MFLKIFLKKKKRVNKAEGNRKKVEMNRIIADF